MGAFLFYLTSAKKNYIVILLHNVVRYIRSRLYEANFNGSNDQMAYTHNVIEHNERALKPRISRYA